MRATHAEKPPQTDNQYNNFNYMLTKTQFRHASLVTLSTAR